MTEHDYSAWTDGAEPGGNLMSRIEGLAQEQLDAASRVQSIEVQLAEAKAAFRLVSERKLPDLLEEAELDHSKITTPGGMVIDVKETIRGSIPKGKEEPAFAWLEDSGNSNLIKRTITIDFAKDQEKWAAKFIRDCRQRKKPLNLKNKKGVNTNTMNAFIKQALKDGVSIPLDIFGAYRQRYSTVKVKT